MKKKELKVYAAFGRLMDEQKVWRDPSVSFSEICSLAGSSTDVLNRILLEEIGMDGEELLLRYKAAERQHFEE